MLSPEARVRLASIVRDRMRDERRRVRDNGGAEPAWFRELDALADRLLVYENDAVTRRKLLSAASSRRYRRRLAAERARQRDAGDA